MQDKLKARFVLECKIETLSPLHIGAGKEEGFAADLPVVKVKENGIEAPLIPGSSIRGVLRAHYERLENAISSALKDKFKLEGIEEEKFVKMREDERLSKIKELGTLQKFFGISSLASPLKIADAKAENYTIITRTHVKINRETDRAEKGALFSAEAVEGVFSFKMVFDEFNGEEYEDVNTFFEDVFLKNLKNGMEVFLGGMKSRGYGLCRLKLERALKFTPNALAFGKEPEVI